MWQLKELCSWPSAQVEDHKELPHPAIRAFSSLGANSEYGGNMERDLHRWLRGLYNFKLQSYTIYLDLQVCPKKSSEQTLSNHLVIQLCLEPLVVSHGSFWVSKVCCNMLWFLGINWISKDVGTWCSTLWICQVNGKTPKRTPVKVLLPHEVLDCLASCCPPHAFSSIILGNLDGPARRRFFEHIKTCDAWRDHPVLCQQGVDYESLIPITLHCDGAQFYRDDENFVWSFGSAFGSTGSIKDVLLTKFPIAIIPERFMQDHAVSRWNERRISIFGCLIWNREFGFEYIKDICLALKMLPSTAYSPHDLQVRQEVNNTIAQLTAWSLSRAAEGTAPQVGFYEEMFDKGSYRFGMRGKQLAKNWKNLRLWFKCFSNLEVLIWFSSV